MASAPNLKVVEGRKVDDAVRERHGCACRNANGGGGAAVSIWEEDEAIVIATFPSDRRLTPWQARYLASKLYRLSRRIRQRSEGA